MSRLQWLLSLLLLSLVACSPTEAPTSAPTSPASAAPVATSAPTPAAQPTSAPETGGQMPTDVNVIKSQVQNILDKYLDAMNKGDEQALAKLVDQDNLTFKRVQNDFLKSPVYSWKGRNPKGMVQKAQIVKEPYVKVWLNEAVRGDHVWVFKWTEQGWLLSEPDEEELGPRKNKETDSYTLRYFEWDEPLVDSMVKSINTAIEAAIKATGRKAKDKFLVRMAPTFQTHSGRAGIGVAANYDASGNFLAIRSPESFGGTFSGTDVSKSIPDIQHEFTHLLVHEATTPKEPYLWLNEAFAYYFTDDLRAPTVKAALANKVYSLKELNQLRANNNEQEDRYIQAEATTVVQYIVEKLGGKEKAWQWMIEETQIRNFDESLRKVLGVPLDQFEKGWQDFMKQKYGG